jgi:PAS domain S-box-containing protein
MERPERPGDQGWPAVGGEMAARIRKHDWSSSPLGPIEDWPERLRAMVELVLESPLVSGLICGPERLVIYNDAAARHYETRSRQSLGGPLQGVFPDSFAALAPFCDRAFAGEATRIAAEALEGAGFAEREALDASLTPVRDSRGEVFCVHIVGYPARERIIAETRLRESEDRQAFLLELSDALRSLTDPIEMQAAAARVVGRRLGADGAYYAEFDPGITVAIVRRDYRPHGGVSLVGEHRIEEIPGLRQALDRGGPLLIDDVQASPAVTGWFREVYGAMGVRASAVVPIAKLDRPTAAIATLFARPHQWSAAEVSLMEETAERTWEAVERARVQMALQESERRQQILIEGAPQFVWRAANQGQWTWASPQWTALTGQSENECRGLGWLDAVHPDDRAAAMAQWRDAVARGELQADYRVRSAAEDRYRWFQTRARPLRSEAGEVVEWLGASTDVNELRELQGRLHVLVAELHHRARNVLGLVRAIADSTLRNSASLADFQRRFRDRISALSRVHDLLSRLEEHERVEFDELIRTELSAISADGGGEGRITLEGPKGVALRSSTVQTLSLALHELATNAAKYGALKQPEGRLEVRWRLEPEGEDNRPWLHVDWLESGVRMPAASSAPRGSGQGRQLIEQALPYQFGARTSLVMGPDGVHCSIALPVIQRATSTESAAHP